MNNNAIAVSEFDDPAQGSAAYTAVENVSSFFILLLATWGTLWHPAWMLLILLANAITAYIASFWMKFKSDDDVKSKDKVAALLPPEEPKNLTIETISADSVIISKS